MIVIGEAPCAIWDSLDRLGRRRGQTHARRSARRLINIWEPVVPANDGSREIPRSALIVIALKEQVVGSVSGLKHIGVPRLAAIPRAYFAVWKHGLIGNPRPSETVEADGAPNLLRPVIVRASIKHIELPVVPAERRCLDALTLPRKLWREDWRVASLSPGVA